MLKIYEQAAHCLPLGTISTQNVTDEIVAMGYPAGDNPKHNKIGFFFSQISQIRADNKIQIPDAIKGRGQSGGPVYHYATKRLIGLATEGYKPDVIMDTGLVTRFDALFEKWQELEIINDKVAQAWEKRLLELGYGGSHSLSRHKNTNITPTDKETSLVVSGKIKIQFCRRLGSDWQELADYLEIPAYRRSQFQQGRECQAIWEWLEERKKWHTLKEALGDLERQD